MRCTFKTVFYVNGSKERNGIVPIMGRVTINGTIETYRYGGTLQRQDTEKSVCHVPR